MTSLDALSITMMTKVAVSLPLTPEIQAKARAMAIGTKPPEMNMKPVKPEMERDNNTLALNTQLKTLF